MSTPERSALPSALLASMQYVLEDAGEALAAADLAWDWFHSHGYPCWIDSDGCSIYPIEDDPQDEYELALVILPRRLSEDDRICPECSPHACDPSTHEVPDD